MYLPQRRPAPVVALLSTIAALSLLPFGAHAQGTTGASAAKPAAAYQPHNETLSEAVTQADGITNAVVDHLWLATDRSFHHGDYYRIVALLRVCVEADPLFTDAYGDGAWLLWSLGDTAGADRFLSYGLKREPKLWDLQYEFGFHLYNTKRYAAALPHLKAATQNKDSDVQAWKMLAHCYDRLGRYADAVATWQTIAQKFPNEPVTAHNLQEMQAKLRATGKPKARQ